METDKEDARAKEIMEELPRIDTAVRNFLSLQLTQTHFYSGATVKKNESTLTREDAKRLVEERKIEPLGSSEAMKVCGSLLRNCNSTILVHPVEWGMKFPQKNEQTGLERIEQLTEYKVKYQLWKHIYDSNEKITKRFGVTMLKLIWDEVKQATVEECATKKLGTAEQLVEFLDIFESTWTGDDEDVMDLVWGANFAQTLKRRHESRLQKASERLRLLEEEKPEEEPQEQLGEDK